MSGSLAVLFSKFGTFPSVLAVVLPALAVVTAVVVLTLPIVVRASLSSSEVLISDVPTLVGE